LSLKFDNFSLSLFSPPDALQSSLFLFLRISLPPARYKRSYGLSGDSFFLLVFSTLKNAPLFFLERGRRTSKQEAFLTVRLLAALDTGTVRPTLQQPGQTQDKSGGGTDTASLFRRARGKGTGFFSPGYGDDVVVGKV
jgi:hypothetical protein